MALALLINYVKTPPKARQEVFTQNDDNKKVKVDVEGAVERPGIYETANDSRIQDVLITAGGMAPKANRIYVSKNINLAQKVYDGLKIYIPEEVQTVSTLGNLSNIGNLVNINTATASQLDTLPGVGEATAKKIISGRPYQNISELIERHLLGQSVYDKIKDLVSL